MTIIPLQFSCSGKTPVLWAVYLGVNTALEKTAVNVFNAARLGRSLSNDVPQHFFFFFLISEPFS